MIFSVEYWNSINLTLFNPPSQLHFETPSQEERLSKNYTFMKLVSLFYFIFLQQKQK